MSTNLPGGGLPPEVPAGGGAAGLIENLLGVLKGGGGAIGGHIGSALIGTLVGFGLSSVLEPYATSVRQDLWPTHDVLAISPADAANAVVQGVNPSRDWAGEAAMWGINASRFADLVALTGLPPGVAELLVMWRRGIIDRDAFDRGVRQGHTKDEYLPHLEKLFHDILSPDVAAQMVVQNILSHDLGAAIAEQGGVDRTDFDRMVEVRGRPISPTEAIDLFRRGKLDRAKFGQVVAESDVKTKYTDDLWNLRYKLPTTPQILHMISKGAISDRLADELLADAGFAPEVAAGLKLAASATKTQKTRDLAESTILTLYEAGAVQRQAAADMLGALGFDSPETDLLLGLSDARMEDRFLQAAINVVHARYVNHQISRNEASADLDRQQVQSKQRDDLIRIWTMERDANVRTLTPAQIESAVADGYIDYPTGLAKLQELGYSAQDAGILLDLKLHRPPKKPEAPGPVGAPS